MPDRPVVAEAHPLEEVQDFPVEEAVASADV